MTKRIGPISLDYETADRITVLTLKEQRGHLKSSMAAWKKNPKTDGNPGGVWMHPEDVVNNTHTISALTLIIKYFGE
jgi:hypothetical protein